MGLSIERTHLDGLVMFLAVAELRGFRAASRQLGVTPSAVSQAIHSLEERIGAPLAGIDVAMTAAANVKRVHLELGGKAPVIVFNDAAIVFGGSRGIGAFCCGNSTVADRTAGRRATFERRCRC